MAEDVVNKNSTIESESSYQLNTPSLIHLLYRTTIPDAQCTPPSSLTRNAFIKSYEAFTKSSCSTPSDQALRQQYD